MPIKEKDEDGGATKKQEEKPEKFWNARYAPSSSQEGNQFQIFLNDKPLKSTKKNPLLVPTRKLAKLVTDEWNHQGKKPVPAKMPFFKFVNTAIDSPVGSSEVAIKDVISYADSDLICYRASEPQSLVDAQSSVWDPMIDYAKLDLGLSLKCTHGLSKISQKKENPKIITRHLSGLSYFELYGINFMTSLTGSAIIALAAWNKRLSADEVFTAAFVDELWHIQMWGEVDMATERLKALRQEIKIICKYLDALRK